MGDLKTPIIFKMRNQKIVLAIMVMLSLMIIVSGEPYYPGQTKTFPNNMSIENLVYTIIGNSTIVPDLNMLIDMKNITVTFPQDMEPDTFTLVFLEEQKQNTHSRSSRTKYIDIIEIQNKTVYVPEYINKEVEVEKIKEVQVDNTINTETGFKTWHIIFAMICGGLFFWLIVRFAVRKKNG